MKIAWFCIPAHGHTNPTLGVVRELTAAGHQVFYFSFEAFREKIEQAGAVFIGCDGYDFDMEDKENADRVGKDKAFATELLVSSTLALDEMTTEKIEAIRPDLIVSDSVAFWGKLVAMKHRIPYVSSTTTFAFNRYSAKYMRETPRDIAKMLFTMPRINRQIRRLRRKAIPSGGFLRSFRMTMRPIPSSIPRSFSSRVPIPFPIAITLSGPPSARSRRRTPRPRKRRCTFPWAR